MKQKLHTLYITVLMDKPCTKGTAASAVRDCIHGEFYPTAFEDDEPETFKVRRVAATAKTRRG